MKALPVKLVFGEGYVPCEVEDCTHVTLNFPGPAGKLTLPVILRGSREGTNCWSWNGNTEQPTLRPSVRTQGAERITDEEHAILMSGGAIEPRRYNSHTWVTDGKANFLEDCYPESLRGQVLDMLEVKHLNPEKEQT